MCLHITGKIFNQPVIADLNPDTVIYFFHIEMNMYVKFAQPNHSAQPTSCQTEVILFYFFFKYNQVRWIEKHMEQGAGSPLYGQMDCVIQWWEHHQGSHAEIHLGAISFKVQVHLLTTVPVSLGARDSTLLLEPNLKDGNEGQVKNLPEPLAHCTMRSFILQTKGAI